MAEFTFLKLQFDDASFAAKAPFSGSGESADEDTVEEDGESVSLLPFLIGLVFLVFLAVVVRRKLSGDTGEPDID